MIKKEIVLNNIGYAINLTYEPDSYHIDFLIHTCTYDNNPDYMDSSASFSPSFIEKKEVNEKTAYIQGSLKWDGCINYTYPKQDTCMLHYCGIDDFARQYKVFQRLYEEAAKIMDHCDFDFCNDND